MQEKLFQHLKQAYASLGLGDSLLKAIADSLAAGVTEENIESLVASQKPILEAMQKANDKRATDAVNKAKAEADAAKQAEKTELEKQIAALQEQLKAQKEPEPKKPETDKGIPDWFTAEQKKMAEQLKAVLESNKTLSDSLTAMKKENDDFKAAKAREERQNFIIKTARELGVPEWRESEGFNIADSASDDEIKTYLTGVANNIRTNMVGSNRFGVPQLADNAEAAKESAKRVAAALVDQM